MPSLKDVNNLTLKGALLRAEDSTAMTEIVNAGGSSMGVHFCYEAMPSALFLVNIPGNSSLTDPSRIHLSVLNAIPQNSCKQVNQVNRQLNFTILRTEKNLFEWPADALVARINFYFASNHSSIVAQRLSRLTKEIRELPLPEKVKRLATQAQNLKFYKTMER